MPYDPPKLPEPIPRIEVRRNFVANHQHCIIAAKPPRPEGDGEKFEHKATVENKLKAVGINANLKSGLTRYPRIYYLESPGADAFKLWEQLRNAAVSTGYWPIIWFTRKEAGDDTQISHAMMQPIVVALETFGIRQTIPIDIVELNKRIEKRPTPAFLPFPKGKVTNQEQALRADALLRLQELYTKEIAQSGVQPGQMPRDFKKVSNTMVIDQKYVPLMLRIMDANADQLSSRHETPNYLSPTRKEIAQFCEEGERTDFAKWVLETEKSSDYYRTTPGSHTGPTLPRTESRVGYDYNYSLRKYEAKNQVIILLVPTTISWRTPAYFAFGNVNANPSPAVHVAAMKHWKTTYGADVISLRDDSSEFYVARPPQTLKQAMALAKEHFVYCPDTVKQGDGTLSQLAAELRGAHYWEFWWD